jgi:hypothetical protein
MGLVTYIFPIIFLGRYYLVSGALPGKDLGYKIFNHDTSIQTPQLSFSHPVLYIFNDPS